MSLELKTSVLNICVNITATCPLGPKILKQVTFVFKINNTFRGGLLNPFDQKLFPNLVEVQPLVQDKLVTMSWVLSICNLHLKISVLTIKAECY